MKPADALADLAEASAFFYGGVMLKDWWTPDTMSDMLRRFYGYNIRPYPPVYQVDQAFYLCAYNDNELTYGYDILPMDLVYGIVLNHMRPLVLKLCSELTWADGADEYSSVRYGLSEAGKIVDTADNVIVEFSPDDFENDQHYHQASDELYALLNLLRITARAPNKLVYDSYTSRGPANDKDVKQAPFSKVTYVAAAPYSGPELLP